MPRRGAEAAENPALSPMVMQLQFSSWSLHEASKGDLTGLACLHNGESLMMATVQLSIADPVYAEDLRAALSRSGPWNVELVDRPHQYEPSVLVLDEGTFAQLLHRVENPERVVLITRQEPELLAQAWEAGIVSVISSDDPLATVLLAIMAASLRIAKRHEAPVASVISPNLAVSPARLSPDNQIYRSKRCKTR